MKINSDINIIGGLPDFNLIPHFLFANHIDSKQPISHHTFTNIRTTKSVNRFEKAIKSTLLFCPNSDSEKLLISIISSELISNDSLLVLFWNASFNNNLLQYLNETIYFKSLFSGRISIKPDEVIACLKDLREKELELKKWSDSTIKTTASKYLTLLKKFNLMKGSVNKTLSYPYLSDKMFVLFIYWIVAAESNSNLLESKWLNYSFNERQVFLERVMQKKNAQYYHLTYTGDKLKIETLIPYENIYNAVK